MLRSRRAPAPQLPPIYRARFFASALSLLLRWRILTEQPRAPEGLWERGRVTLAVLLHGDACCFTTLGERLRMTATKCIAGDCRRGRRMAQQLRDHSTLADENAAAGG